MLRRSFLVTVGLGLVAAASTYRLGKGLIGDRRSDALGSLHPRRPGPVRSLFAAEDQDLFAAGAHHHLYEKLGAHIRTDEAGAPGVTFAVWAPAAKRVSVVGSFNNWDGGRHPMARDAGTDVWECFIPGAGAGDFYKYRIVTDRGSVLLKADPFAFLAELRPGTASIVYDIGNAYQWRDHAWLEKRRATRIWKQPISIYEAHIGSWRRRPDGGFYSYKETAAELIPYVKSLGFTHIELLPITEYPFDGSWGYQVGGFYAATARFGRPDELMSFIDECHQNGIGVLLDWVPGHFPKDPHGLRKFDGTPLYEYADPRKGEHPDWGTLCFDLDRPEVRSFLIANALFWIDRYHFDGLRVDAVASMLYLDYSRRERGNFVLNKNGGRENLEAIEFLKDLNTVVHGRFPGVMMVAEESSAWPRVSRPTYEGGLGFGFKWNMGWMHDVLDYMRTPPTQRQSKQNRITFGLTYAFSENFVLPFSHDEVVHIKGSMINKMPGDEVEKFANLRLLYTFMYGHPGKKLLFMGAEFAQSAEWDHAGSLAWAQTGDVLRQGLTRLVRDLNRLYSCERALYETDFESAGFEWLEVNGAGGVFVFLRKGEDDGRALVFALNFSGEERVLRRIFAPAMDYELILDSNAAIYGGKETLEPSRYLRKQMDGRAPSMTLSLSPLTGIILRRIEPVVATKAALAARSCR